MTSVAPAHRAAPQMTHTPDPVATPQADAATSALEAGPTKPRLRDQIAENPLLSLFLGLTLAVLTFLSTLAVALLMFTLNDINDGLDSLGERIDGVEVSLGERIDGVEVSLGERIDGVEVSLGERIDGVEVSLGERIDGVEVSLGERIDRVEVNLNGRIDRVEVNLNGRIDRLEAKVDAGFAAQGAHIVETDRKLTALITHLNATEAVDAALEGRLLDGMSLG